jgi:hypothetical protein
MMTPTSGRAVTQSALNHPVVHELTALHAFRTAAIWHGDDGRMTGGVH